ncbi:MAG: hypothetical protein K0R52_1641 [Alphaproteobacteria bacterium]|jgi:hypothetical protein|nr:hypothetical protein [Alphaproteobacteria bacterium]
MSVSEIAGEGWGDTPGMMMLLERFHAPSPVAIRSGVANCADLSHKGRGIAALMLPDAWG